MILDFVLFIVLGAISGGIAGLLGIGGGALVVPGLAFVFTLMGMSDHMIMQMASGTSLMIMVFTAISSSIAHIKQGHVHWEAFRKMLLGVVCGTILGAFIARLLHSDVLTLIFALFLLGVAIKMWLSAGKHQNTKSWGQQVDPRIPGWVRIAALFIGLKSGLLGIGGGTLSVPLLIHCKNKMQYW